MCHLSERMLSMLKVLDDENLVGIVTTPMNGQYRGLEIGGCDSKWDTYIAAYLDFPSYAETTPENFWPALEKALAEMEEVEGKEWADSVRDRIHDLIPKMQEALLAYDQQSH